MVKHRTRERFEWYANAGTSHKIRAFLILNMSKADIFRHCPKENRSTCFRSFLSISAPFRSETHPFRHSYLHCFRVLRACLWDKLWSSKTPRMQLSPHPRCFCRLYGNSCSSKSQGLSRNKFCPAVDKEKGIEKRREK